LINIFILKISPFWMVSSTMFPSTIGYTVSWPTSSTVGASVSTLGSIWFVSGTSGSGLVSALEVARLSEPSLLGRISSWFPCWETPRPSAEPTALSTLGVDVLGLCRLGLFWGVVVPGVTSPRRRGNVLARMSLVSERLDVTIGWVFCRFAGRGKCEFALKVKSASCRKLRMVRKFIFIYLFYFKVFLQYLTKKYYTNHIYKNQYYNINFTILIL